VKSKAVDVGLIIFDCVTLEETLRLVEFKSHARDATVPCSPSEKLCAPAAPQTVCLCFAAHEKHYKQLHGRLWYMDGDAAVKSLCAAPAAGLYVSLQEVLATAYRCLRRTKDSLSVEEVEVTNKKSSCASESVHLTTLNLSVADLGAPDDSDDSDEQIEEDLKVDASSAREQHHDGDDDYGIHGWDGNGDDDTLEDDLADLLQEAKDLEHVMIRTVKRRKESQAAPLVPAVATKPSTSTASTGSGKARHQHNYIEVTGGLTAEEFELVNSAEQAASHAQCQHKESQRSASASSAKIPKNKSTETLSSEKETDSIETRQAILSEWKAAVSCTVEAFVRSHASTFVDGQVSLVLVSNSGESSVGSETCVFLATSYVSV
jgi:hypothetical protein